MTKQGTNNITGSFIPHQFLQEKRPLGEAVDLNEILRTVLNKYTVEQNNSILRYDKLPLVKGTYDQFFCLIAPLLSMIMNHPPVKSKLFLYIRCKEEEPQNDIIDLRLTKDVKLYKIDFHTNITTTPEWKASYLNSLKECTLFAAQYSASFSFYTISNTGCLFTIILPGKIIQNAIVQ